MTNFLKRKKNSDPIRFKKFIKFSIDEVNSLDEILYSLYSYSKIPPSTSTSRKNLYSLVNKISHQISVSKIDELIQYLYINSYIFTDDDFLSGSDIESNYIIKSKGKIICEQGGLHMLREKQKNQNYSKWISIISAIIALFALVANIWFSYSKEC